MPEPRAIPGLLLAAALCVATPVAAEVAEGIAGLRAAELEHMVIQDCGSCHGLTLKGGLGTPLTRDALEGTDPATLALIILDGVPDTAMPPWRPLLTEDEARWIADFLLQGETEK